MHRGAPLLACVAALAAARPLAGAARSARGENQGISEPPFAPSRESAPFFSLGYRELAADLLWVRLIGYAAGDDDLARANAELLEAIFALDPYYRPAYESGVERVLVADRGLDLATLERAATMLEQGADRFPDAWRYPFGAGQIYALDLQPLVEAGSPAHRAYGERAIDLLDRAVRLPDAPASAGILAAELLTDLGRAQQAEANLRERILTTESEAQRAKLVDKLARMRADNATDLRDQLAKERLAFERAWRSERPSLPPSVYVHIAGALGTRPLADLAIDRPPLSPPATPPTLPPLADDVGELP